MSKAEELKALTGLILHYIHSNDIGVNPKKDMQTAKDLVELFNEEFKHLIESISDDIPIVIVEKGTLCGCGAELTIESVGMGIVDGKPSFLKVGKNNS